MHICRVEGKHERKRTEEKYLGVFADIENVHNDMSLLFPVRINLFF